MSFDLRSLPDEKGRHRLFLVQLPLRMKMSGLGNVDVPTTKASLDGSGLDFAKGALGGIQGIGTAESFLGKDTSIRLDEEQGVRVALMCMALSSARANDRLAGAAKQIMELDVDEALYWFTKLAAAGTLPKEKGERLRRTFFQILDIDVD